MAAGEQIEERIEGRTGLQRSDVALLPLDGGVQPRFHSVGRGPKSIPSTAIWSSGDHIELTEYHS
jgi:hypothetical protein